MDTKNRLSRIEISKEALNFSAAHFTIFSATEREDLHGHNFQVQCYATAELGDDGLMFDYAVLKRLLRKFCDEIDEKMILPDRSPHLSISQDEDYVVAHYNGERIPFLPRDVLILPIANSTVEELSYYFLDKVRNDPDLVNRGIQELTIKVSSSPGQAGVAEWKREGHKEGSET